MNRVTGEEELISAGGAVGTDLVVEEEDSSLDLFLFSPFFSEAKSWSSGSSFTLNPRNRVTGAPFIDHPAQRRTSIPRGEPPRGEVSDPEENLHKENLPEENLQIQRRTSTGRTSQTQRRTSLRTSTR